MMELTLERVKLYLRIDENSEDEFLKELIEFSKEEIENSTGVKYVANKISSTYKMAQLIIIADRYENRTSQDSAFVANNALSGLYTKLKYGGPDEEESN